MRQLTNINERFRILPTPTFEYERSLCPKLKTEVLFMARMGFSWLLHSFKCSDRSNLFSYSFSTFFVLFCFPNTGTDHEQSTARLPSLTSLLTVLIYSSYSRWRWMDLALPGQACEGHVRPVPDCCSFLSTTQVVILWGHKTGSFNITKWYILLPEQS